jgi:ATP-dependent Clp protease ATP-binding subunit ClpC
MQARLPLYVRRYTDGRFTLSVLTHPQFCIYGERLAALREQLGEALARELALKGLVLGPADDVDGLSSEVLDLSLRAIQHERLVTVPMRFLVLHRVLPTGNTEVFVPRLDLRFRVRGQSERLVWTEERIRGHFHLAPVAKLLAHRFAKHERVETLVVRYHGAARYKAEARRRALAQTRREALASGPGGPLAAAGIELVEEARRGRLPRALGRDRVVDRLVDALAGPAGRAVVLRGPAGAGKTALVHELAHRIAAGRVPDPLRDTVIWHVTGNRMLAGLPFLGQWQERTLAVAHAMRANGGILFGDALLELAMAGHDAEGASVASLLDPFVRDDAIRFVVESTDDAWTLAERRAPQLSRRLRRIDVPSMPADAAIELLRTLGARMGRKQDTVVADDALQRAFELLARFGDADGLPGSGLALLDRMIRLAPGRTLTPADAITAFCRTTGFPAALVDPERPLDEAAVTGFFTERVVGQPEAVQALVERILVVKAGLADPGRPLASLLLVGPTGVGKTESAKALAAWLFGDPSRLLRFDMSEFAGVGAAHRLTDGPNSLTARVRERPFAVVLLDELEKADASVFDVLLQVLDEGRLSDATGRLTSFRHTLILMTSNLGADERRPIGPHGPVDPGQRYQSAAEGFFRPEFVNRIGGVVPFAPLSPDVVRVIARALLVRALQREGLTRRGVEVTWDEAVLDVLVREGHDPRYGARPMKRALDRLVVEPLSRALVTGEARTWHLAVEDDVIVVR